MHSSLFLVSVLAWLCTAFLAVRSEDKIYGVNLGSWLILESWMLPQEWLDMGGQSCSDCSQCIATEFAFAKAYPDTVDEIFAKHWSTWFTQQDVNALVEYGINTVRIPLGYWIVEALVDRSTEFYPRGGLAQLIRGLGQLKNAGIQAILDHHALPGVQSPNQMFTGHCTSDVEFYTDKNYQRALVWTVVMTVLSHMHPAFESVFAIEAVNEPIMDASQTPGYGYFQKNFVEAVRATELTLGIPVKGMQPLNSTQTNTNVTAMMSNMIESPVFNANITAAIATAIPILAEIAMNPETGYSLDLGGGNRRTNLITNFMDINWQNNNPANPADAAIGPQAYDNHLYYVFGGVAAANPDAYMTSICNLNRVQSDAALGDSPLWFGEWGLPTQFDATDAFLMQWADAQKMAYSKGAGWVFWNFKVEKSTLAGNLSREWSYFDGVERGYLTRDPSAYHDASVCAPYISS